MSKIIICLLLLSFGISNSHAQSTFIQKYGSEDDYKRLYFLNIQYIQSWVRSDTSTYNHLLWADDFVHQNSGDGLLYPKKKIAPLFGQPRFEKLNYFFPENVTIQFITTNAAMIFARTPLQLVGQTTESASQYNDIYVKRDGNWVCVSANVTPLSAPERAPTVLKKIPEPAQLTSYLEGSSRDKEALKELNAKHAEAFAKSNAALLEPILADDFVLLAGNGLLYRKQEVLNQLNAQTNNIIESYTVENYIVRFVAVDIALIHAVFIATHKGGIKTGTQYNDIYVKREGSWICVSGNNTPIQ